MSSVSLKKKRKREFVKNKRSLLWETSYQLLRGVDGHGRFKALRELSRNCVNYA